MSFNAGDFGFGLMWAASGVGAVVGALFSSSWLERRSMTAVYSVAIGMMGFADVAAAVSPNVWIAVWCIVVGGVGNAAAIVCNSLLVQRGAPTTSAAGPSRSSWAPTSRCSGSGWWPPGCW